MATIYCPNGNRSLRLFRTINALSKQVIFLGNFNSNHKQFGCAKPNKSGQALVNIAKDLKLFYINQLGPNRHTRQAIQTKYTTYTITLFDKTDGDILHNILKDSPNSIDIDITTQDELEELAVTLCDKLMKAVNTSTPKTYSRNNPKSPISQAILDLITEKRRLRRLYDSTHDPNTKSTINKLQKEIRTKINKESTISWEKLCNSISLESDPKNHCVR